MKSERFPWYLAKGQDSFLPISKFISKTDVIDPHNLKLNLFINNEVRQSDNTGNMHYKIGETIEFISKYSTLHPGDLILTGTPSGIGPVKLGDKIRANLEQNGKVIVEMNYSVIEDNEEPKF